MTEYVPKLTLNPTAAAEAEAPAQEESTENAVVLDLEQLSPEEQKMVVDFSKQIDILKIKQ